MKLGIFLYHFGFFQSETYQLIVKTQGSPDVNVLFSLLNIDR